MIDEVAELLAPRRRQAGVDLRVEGDSRRITLWCDARQVRQILWNTLLNALEAAGEGGWVSVSARPAEDGRPEAVITVADSGPGIPDELRERVFNPFFTTKDRGTGLGLAIVHQLVEAHGGSIAVGRHPAGGAMFTIRLPRVADQGDSEDSLRE